MKDLALQILELQSLWTDKNTPAMEQRGRLIRDEVPAWLELLAPRLSKAMASSGRDLAFEGRDGTGRKTELPWVRYYSESRSPNAREGWYCVYHFHAHGEGFYLCLQHGSTRWENGEFKPRTDRELAELVKWAHDRLAATGAPAERLLSNISLGARGSNLGDAYEKGTAVAQWYPRSDVPSSAELADDAERFAELLGRLYNDYDLGRGPESRSPEVALAEAAAEAISRPTPSSKRGGQGFGLTPQERKVVERRAMALAEAHLVELGFAVDDVSATRPYDLVATRDDVRLTVEVKGSTARLAEVLLTANEVRHQRLHYPQNGLVVVSEIDLDRSRIPPKASGGLVRYVHPWKIDDEALSAISFSCRLPVDEPPME